MADERDALIAAQDERFPRQMKQGENMNSGIRGLLRIWLSLGLCTLPALWFVLAFLGDGSVREDRSEDEARIAAAPVPPRGAPLSVVSTQRPYPIAVGAPSSAPVAAPFALTFAAQYFPARYDGSEPESWAEFHSAEIGDVTGDHRDDLVSVGQTDDPVVPWMLYVYPQQANGTLGTPIRYSLDRNDPFIALSLADMNNDGIQDVVLTQADTITVLLSKVRGPSTLSVFASTQSENFDAEAMVVSLDADGDGNLDLITHLALEYGKKAEDPRSKFRIYYGDGTGRWARVATFGKFGNVYDSVSDVENVSSMVAADLNSDGFPDLAAMSQRFDFAAQQNPLFRSIYLNDRKGGFLAPIVVSANVKDAGGNLTIPKYVAAGDFNGDGRKDLVETADFNFPVAGAWIFLQNQGGSIPGAPSYSRSADWVSTSLDVYDVNRDGRDDVLLAHSGQGHGGYLMQTGGILSDEVFYGIGSEDASLNTTAQGIGDLNSDGCTDTAVGARYFGLLVFHGMNCVSRAVSSGSCLTQKRSSPTIRASLQRMTGAASSRAVRK